MIHRHLHHIPAPAQPILLLLALASGAAAQVTPYTGAEDGTMFLFHLDEAVGSVTAADAGGSGLHLRRNGVSPFNGEPGPAGLSTAPGAFTHWNYQLNRALTVDECESLKVPAFTVELWFKFPGPDLPLDAFNSQVRFRGGGTNRIAVVLDGNRYNPFRLNLQGIGSSTPFTVEVEKWYHVGVSYDPRSPAANDGLVRFYLDPEESYDPANWTLLSVLCGRTDSHLGIICPAELTIGGPNHPVNHYWSAKTFIDEVRLVSKVIANSDGDAPEPYDCPADPDEDDDGVLDVSDNCVFAPNPGQEDGDGDGVGDACDNCPAVPNPGQEDADGCGAPVDSDGDGLDDPDDNCPNDPNPGQEDSDGDGNGDVCDLCLGDDADGDADPALLVGGVTVCGPGDGVCDGAAFDPDPLDCTSSGLCEGDCRALESFIRGLDLAEFLGGSARRRSVLASRAAGAANALLMCRPDIARARLESLASLSDGAGTDYMVSCTGGGGTSACDVVHDWAQGQIDALAAAGCLDLAGCP